MNPHIEEEGLKDYGHKPRIDLIDPDSILGLAECLEYGCRKYKPNSWQNIKDPLNTHYAALMRHILAWKKGELDDPESGIAHIKHVLSNAMFLLYHENRFLRDKKKNLKDL